MSSALSSSAVAKNSARPFQSLGLSFLNYNTRGLEDDRPVVF